jgi:hypothetical protein
MDRRRLEQYLAQAEGHIDGVHRRIDQQTRIVEQIKAAGRDSAMAEELLAQFKMSLQSFLTDRDLILRFIRSLDAN